MRLRADGGDMICVPDPDASDAFHVIDARDGDDTLSGHTGDRDSDGVDTFSYEVCDTLETFTTGQVAVTVGTSHCTIVGTDGDDILRGTLGDDVICGSAALTC